MKMFLTTLCALCLLVSTAYADDIMPTCNKTDYTHPVKGISYGMLMKDVESTLRGNYPSPSYTIKKDEDTWYLEFSEKSTFDRYVFNFVSGRLVNVKIVYSEVFQNSMGGFDPASASVLKKAADKYGAIKNFENIQSGLHSGHKVFWPLNKGASLLMVSIGGLVMLGYECDDLIEYLRAQKQKSTNFGF